MLFDFVLLMLLALLNGFFAMSEMAVMTARKSRLRQLAKDSRSAEVALRLAESPERFLSTVQVGITLVGIGTGTALGFSIGDHIAVWLRSFDLAYLIKYSLPIGLAISVTLITFLSMVFGELVPKRLALVNPERLAMLVAVPMLVLAKAMTPFVWVLMHTTSMLLALIGVRRGSGAEVSEEEIRLLVAEGAEQGVIDLDERNMVNRVLRLGDRTVDSVMTPRTRIAWLNAAAPLADNVAVMHDTPYSRYPVYRNDEREVLGIVEIKYLLDAVGGQKVDIFQRLAKPVYVPATARALHLLEVFRDSDAPLALVVDEYGEIQGLVTLNDVLAAVLGTAVQTETTTDSPIIQRPDGSYLIDGALPSEDLRELLALGTLPREEDHDYRTVAGMMMAHFGRIPQAAESFSWRGFRFEVIDMDGPRIDKILIARIAEDDAGVE